MDNLIYLNKIDKLKFECFKEGGEKIIVDATLSYGGDGLKYSPLDIMLFSLGSCTGVTISKFYPFKDLSIKISSEMESYKSTSIFKHIELTLETKENISKSKLDQLINISLRTCPVHAMFITFCTIKIIFISNGKEYIY